MNKKLILFLIVLIMGGVYLFTIGSASPNQYSEPTYQNGESIDWQKHEALIKTNCDKNEWNNNFNDYRNGLISREDMKGYVRSCKW